MVKKNLLFALLTMICINNITFAQIKFQNIIGGTSEDDGGNSVQQASDSGYVIAGFTDSFGAGNDDVYLIKTTANGDILWAKTFGGPSNDEGNSVQQTTDGGYIVAGTTRSFGAGNQDIYLIKTTANGDTLWSKTFGGTNEDVGSSVQQTADGGFIIAGYTRSFGAGSEDVYLIKTTANGDTLWTKTFGGTDTDWGYSVQQTADGGYIIAGETYSFGVGNSNVFLIKTTSNGFTLWTKTFGGTNYDCGYSVQQTADGGYIVAGMTWSFGVGSSDVYLIKTNANGDILWTKTYGGTSDEYCYSVQQTSNGGYIVAGMSSSFGAGNWDIYIIRSNVNGDTLWTKTYGGGAWDYSYSVEQTADGGYIIAGDMLGSSAGSCNVYLIKTDSIGDSGCNQGNPATITSNPATQQTSPLAIITTPTTICTTPKTIIGSGGTITTLCTNLGISELSSDFQNINIYPNPVQDNLNVLMQPDTKATSIKIYNIYGAIVREVLINKNVTIISFSELTDGLYFYKITDSSSNTTYCGKILKEK